MANKDLINLGITPDSGTGDSARLGGAKINALFADIYSQLGDIAISLDNTSPYYAWRKPLEQYEYKVGELHPAGNYRRIAFFPDSDGYYDARGRYYTLFDSTTGWNDKPTVTIAGVNVPILYTKTNWYFLSRGEAINVDLTYTDSDVNLVLPVARVGDVVRVRDAFNTVNATRGLRIWTTPYKFLNDPANTAPITNFFANTPGFIEAGGRDSDRLIANAISLSSNTGSTGTDTNSSYRSWDGSDSEYQPFPDTLSYLRFEYGGDEQSVPPNAIRTSWVDLEFVFLGAQRGWVYRATSLDPTGVTSIPAQTEVLGVPIAAGTQPNKYFTPADWLPIGVDVKGTSSDPEEIVVPAGWYVLPFLFSGVSGVNDPSSTALFQVFRQISTHSAASAPYFQTLQTQMLNISTGAAYTLQQQQLARIWLNNFSNQSSAAPVFLPVELGHITDEFGNLLLIAQFPFTGYVRFVNRTV